MPGYVTKDVTYRQESHISLLTSYNKIANKISNNISKNYYKISLSSLLTKYILRDY